MNYLATRLQAIRRENILFDDRRIILGRLTAHFIAEPWRSEREDFTVKHSLRTGMMLVYDVRSA